MQFCIFLVPCSGTGCQEQTYDYDNELFHNSIIPQFGEFASG
jgi:hypothetical protein